MDKMRNIVQEQKSEKFRYKGIVYIQKELSNPS